MGGDQNGFVFDAGAKGLEVLKVGNGLSLGFGNFRFSRPFWPLD